ncbi:MAG TPA: OmpA family protein [Amaricoccus sp.]|nr:OmpA family protein [Amaricoccus sp.]
MQGKLVYIAGGAAALLAGIVALRSNIPDDLTGKASPPPVTAAAPGPLSPPAAAEPAPLATPTPSGADDLARLAAEIARREAEIAELRTTLAVRDAVIDSLRLRLDEGRVAADDLAARLAASEAELAALREEIAELRDLRSIEAKRAVFAADTEPGAPGPATGPAAGEPSAARVELVRSEAADLDAIFDAAKAPPGVPPLPGRDTVSIQFDFASSRLSPGGQLHAAAAAVVIADRSLVRVRLVGYTDRVGSPAANRRLAARRAASVADFLVASGVPRELIEIDDRGETDLPVATADGVPEPLNRSVEIRLLSL